MNAVTDSLPDDNAAAEEVLRLRFEEALERGMKAWGPLFDRLAEDD